MWCVCASELRAEKRPKTLLVRNDVPSDIFLQTGRRLDHVWVVDYTKISTTILKSKIFISLP